MPITTRRSRTRKRRASSIGWSRLGWALRSHPQWLLDKARARVLRYILINEFRSDLSGEPPASIGMVPTPSLKDQLDRVREAAQRLRKEFPERYVAIADQVEDEHALRHAAIDPACLGSIDTFRFEEKALLHHAAELAAAKRFDESVAIVTARARSFWVDRDVARQVQWRACGLPGRAWPCHREGLGVRGQDGQGPCQVGGGLHSGGGLAPG